MKIIRMFFECFADNHVRYYNATLITCQLFHCTFTDFFVWLVIGMVTTTNQPLVCKRREHFDRGACTYQTPVYTIFLMLHNYISIQFETDICVIFEGGDLHSEMLFTDSS